MQRTDIEPDGYFPGAKHARRTPTSAHFVSVPTNGTSNGRAASHQPATADTNGERAFTTVEEGGHRGSPDLGAAHPEQIRDAAPHASGTDVDRVSVIWHARQWIVASTLLVSVHVGSPRRYVGGRVQLVCDREHPGRHHPGWLSPGVGLSLAAQDALLVTSDSVLTAAAHQLDISPSTLSSHLSSGTLSAQNLIQIAAQGPSGDDAQRCGRRQRRARSKPTWRNGHRRASTSLRNSITAQTESLDQHPVGSTSSSTTRRAQRAGKRHKPKLTS